MGTERLSVSLLVSSRSGEFLLQFGVLVSQPIVLLRNTGSLWLDGISVLGQFLKFCKKDKTLNFWILHNIYFSYLKNTFFQRVHFSFQSGNLSTAFLVISIFLITIIHQPPRGIGCGWRLRFEAIFKQITNISVF